MDKNVAGEELPVSMATEKRSTAAILGVQNNFDCISLVSNISLVIIWVGKSVSSLKTEVSTDDTCNINTTRLLPKT